MAEIRWSVAAREDLKGIEDFIALDSPLVAVYFVDRLVEAAERLTDFPESGRIVPEFGRDDLREVVFRSYRIVYLLRGDVVTVVRVVHAARALEALARREPREIE